MVDYEIKADWKTPAFVVFLGLMGFPAGILLLLPDSEPHNVPAGIAICVGCAAMISFCLYRIFRMPVLLRMTMTDLQFPSKRLQAIPWSDIERVDVRTLKATMWVIFSSSWVFGFYWS